MFPWPSVLGCVKLLGDFHRLFNLVEKVDFGSVGTDVAEEELGGFFAEF
jgi:hypothetical protein